MSKTDKKSINAKEARKITNSTDKPLYDIYDLIRDSATEGYTRLTYDTSKLSSSILDRIIKQLNKDGFIIDTPSEQCVTITIRW